jgi:hypothetical protein
VDADKDTGNLKSLVCPVAKTILLAVRESADTFGPIKSVAGGLCYILENYEVQSFSRTRDPQHLQLHQRMRPDKQSIESLAPRVQEVAKLLYAPVSQNDIDEQSRRGVLER